MELGPANEASEAPMEQTDVNTNLQVDNSAAPAGEERKADDALANAASKLNLKERKKRNSAFQKARAERRKQAKIAAGTWTELPPKPKAQPKVRAETETAKADTVKAIQGCSKDFTATPSKRQRSEESTPSSGNRRPKKTRWDEGPKTTGTGGSFADRLISIKTAVTFSDYPERKLDKKQGEELIYMLTIKLSPIQGDKMPEFNEHYRLEGGALILFCANKETRAWVNQTVSELGPLDGGMLQVGDANKVLNRVRVITRIHYPYSKMKVEEVLKHIDKHNPKVRATEWRVVNTRLEDNVSTVVFSLSEADVADLKKHNMKLGLGLGLIVFKVAEKKLLH